MCSDIYVASYSSPLGILHLMANKDSLVSLCFEDATFTNKNVNILPAPPLHPPITQTKLWLEYFFLHRIPPFIPSLQLIGTPFMKIVWENLLKVPYGTTITYGELSKIVAKHKNIPKMSAQAIGMALKRNPIAIIVPCHRVIGKNGKLIGYGGGLERKQLLLKLEKETLKTGIKN